MLVWERNNTLDDARIIIFHLDIQSLWNFLRFISESVNQSSLGSFHTSNVITFRIKKTNNLNSISKVIEISKILYFCFWHLHCQKTCLKFLNNIFLFLSYLVKFVLSKIFLSHDFYRFCLYLLVFTSEEMYANLFCPMGFYMIIKNLKDWIINAFRLLVVVK